MQFLRAASLEAKDFVCDIKNSLDEQREILDFSAKQQEEVSQFLPLYISQESFLQPMQVFITASFIFYPLIYYTSFLCILITET